MAEKILNRFERLNCIDVGDHIEKKNGLSYLSWAWAWTEFKKIFPDSFYTIYEREDGVNYWTDGKTCWVKTGVTLVDGDFCLEHIEELPIMDFRNKSIAVDNITSMEVNKAIQRSLTKAIARHGLGCYIYAGEDLPEEPESVKQEREENAKKLKEELKVLRTNVDTEVKRITAKFDNTAKMEFAKAQIMPIIGQANYKTCADNNKLKTLLENLKKIKAESAA